MSTLTWLDFSDSERRRALQVVELLGRPETRDELGLGLIRDTFAEALFPGMSTVQRRARYFLFIPWIFRDIERRSDRRGDPLERTRRRELMLVETLLDAGEQDGVIGARARKRLRQLPSTIYWQGLARWGIRRGSGTREQWARSIRGAGNEATDDNGQLVRDGASWWHQGLVEPPDDWPDGTTLALEPPEADYLRDRIRASRPGTMLAVLAERRTAWEPVDFPWELGVPELDPHQRRVLAHARRFSEVMHGAALLYNHTLAVESENETLEETYSDELDRWADSEARAQVEGWTLADMWALLEELGSNHSPRTGRFVKAWIERAAEPSQAIGSPAAVALIRDRERGVKGRQARLSFDAARETWRGAAGAGQLTYRWGSAQRQLLDIVGVEEP